METPLITIEDVHFAYDTDEVLHNINLTIQAGDFVTFLGANGSGKSTMMKIILGLLTPQIGDVKINGVSIKKYNHFQMMGYVPQGGILSVSHFPATVLEMIQLRGKGHSIFDFYRKANINKAMDALAQVNLQDKADSLIANLSGGQLQRALIARELMNQPEILFLDEPTNGLDKEAIEDLYQLLQTLNQQGITVILVTHDYFHAQQLVSRKIIFDNHQIEEQSC